MDKFTVRVIVPKSTCGTGSTIVRIPQDTYNRLLTVKKKTGISMSKLMSSCVEFALNRLEIEYVDSDEADLMED